jgi:hypothetical protein
MCRERHDSITVGIVCEAATERQLATSSFSHNQPSHSHSVPRMAFHVSEPVLLAHLVENLPPQPLTGGDPSLQFVHCEVKAAASAMTGERWERGQSSSSKVGRRKLTTDQRV